MQENVGEISFNIETVYVKEEQDTTEPATAQARFIILFQFESSIYRSVNNPINVKLRNLDLK